MELVEDELPYFKLSLFPSEMFSLCNVFMHTFIILRSEAQNINKICYSMKYVAVHKKSHFVYDKIVFFMSVQCSTAHHVPQK